LARKDFKAFKALLVSLVHKGYKALKGPQVSLVRKDYKVLRAYKALRGLQDS
jgi:hypothetical protein